MSRSELTFPEILLISFDFVRSTVQQNFDFKAAIMKNQFDVTTRLWSVTSLPYVQKCVKVTSSHQEPILNLAHVKIVKKKSHLVLSVKCEWLKKRTSNFFVKLCWLHNHNSNKAHGYLQVPKYCLVTKTIHYYHRKVRILPGHIREFAFSKTENSDMPLTMVVYEIFSFQS